MRKRTSPHLYLRGATWWCYWRNERWSTKTTDRAEAETRVRNHYDPRHSTARQATIEDAIRLVYEVLAQKKRSDATQTNARGKLGHFARLWAGKPLHDISYATVQEYIRTRLEVDGVKPLTVSHELGYLRQAWNLASAHDWTTRTWLQLMPTRFDKKYVPRTRSLSQAEVKAVVFGGIEDQRYAAWVAWILVTGCDVSDVPRFTMKEIDRTPGGSRVWVAGQKNKHRQRWVPVTPLTEELFHFALQYGPPFVDWKWANSGLRRVAKRLGIPHFTPKDLRRTFATWLAEADVNKDHARRMMGHGPRSTMLEEVYTHGADEKIGDLVREQVDASLKKDERPVKAEEKVLH